MEWSHTRYEVEKGVATVTLHRPEQMNALTQTMRKELIGIFAAADQDDSVRAVVVRGAGNAFCAGADLSSGGSTFNRTLQEGRRCLSANIGTVADRLHLPFSDAGSR